MVIPSDPGKPSFKLTICWIVGDHLQDKYGVATFVKPTKRGRLKVKKDSGTIPTANDLVFLKKSPDYCHANPTIGSLGELIIKILFLFLLEKT
jgi:hypothetical protein